VKLEFTTDPESLDHLGEDWDDSPEEDVAEKKIRQIEDLRLHRLQDIALRQIEWDVEGIIPRRSVCLISGLPDLARAPLPALSDMQSPKVKRSSVVQLRNVPC